MNNIIKQKELQIEIESVRSRKLLAQKLGYMFCLLSSLTITAFGVGVGYDITWLGIVGGMSASLSLSAAIVCARLYKTNMKKQQDLKKELDLLISNNQTNEYVASKDATKSFNVASKKEVCEQKEAQDVLEL